MYRLASLFTIVFLLVHTLAVSFKPQSYLFDTYPSSTSPRRLTELWTQTYHRRIETHPPASHLWNQLSSFQRDKKALDDIGLSASLECDDCQAVVSRVIDLSLAGKSTAEIKAVMSTECYEMFPDEERGKTCESSASFMLLLGPAMVEKIAKLDWNAEAFCAGWLTSCTVDCCESDSPEQVRLSLWADFASIGITWVQRAPSPGNVTVAAESEQVAAAVNSVADTYTSGGWRGYVHTVLLERLKCGTRYTYTIANGAATVYTNEFRTPACDVGVSSPLRVAHVADIDYAAEGSGTAALVARLAAEGALDAVMLVGDIGYADGYERHNDVFGRLVSTFAARVPVLACPGNHEVWSAFEAFKTRFPSPACDWRQVPRKRCVAHFSVSLGPLHVQLLNGESEIDTPYIDDAQRAWAGNDVINARNHSAQWVISALHRPPYSTIGDKEGGDYSRYLRSRLEDFYAAGAVDAVFTGHVHAYEHTHPVREEEVTNWPDQDNRTPLPALPAGISGGPATAVYSNTKAPIYVVNGVGGTQRGMGKPACDKEWCARAGNDLGFGLLTVQGNVMRYDYVRTENGEVFDTWAIVK